MDKGDSLEDPRILIVTAVDIEKDAVLRGMGKQINVDVLVGGVGPIVSAIHTSVALERKTYDWIINMGIGGGFRNQASIGSLVVASEMIAVDFGVETPTGFSFADEVGLGRVRIISEEKLRTSVLQAFDSAGLKTVTGPILTVSTCTGTEATTKELQRRVPQAAAEAMEGFGVAAAGLAKKIPVLEVRAISNVVGQRDKTKWRIDEALESLTKASKAIMEVIR